MQGVDFHKLYYFYIVAKTGSIKSASKSLNVTAPTISVQIQQLEDQLGVTLFERKHRKLILTEPGNFLLAKSERLFRQADEMIEEIPGAKIVRRKNIRIGALQSLANSFICDFSINLWRDKSIEVDVVQGDFKNLMDRLDSGEIDILLTDSSVQKSRKYRCAGLGLDQLVAVGARGLEKLRKTFPNSLDGVPYLAYSHKSRIQEEIDYFFERNNVAPERIGHVDDVTLMRVVTTRTKCISILPFRAVKEALKSGEVIKIGELSGVKHGIWAITSTTSKNQKLIKKIINEYFLKK